MSIIKIEVAERSKNPDDITKLRIFKNYVNLMFALNKYDGFRNLFMGNGNEDKDKEKQRNSFRRDILGIVGVEFPSYVEQINVEKDAGRFCWIDIMKNGDLIARIREGNHSIWVLSPKEIEEAEKEIEINLPEDKGNAKWSKCGFPEFKSQFPLHHHTQSLNVDIITPEGEESEYKIVGGVPFYEFKVLP